MDYSFFPKVNNVSELDNFLNKDNIIVIYTNLYSLLINKKDEIKSSNIIFVNEGIEYTVEHLKHELRVLNNNRITKKMNAQKLREKQKKLKKLKEDNS